jgi:hypothetical protein
MSDIFKDNPELFTTGSVEEIVNKIENEWWEDKRKQLSKLSGSIDIELIELLPRDTQNRLVQSPEVVDEENEDRFLLKTTTGKKGKKFEIQSPTKLYKESLKFQKKEKEEVIDILFNLSAQPSGSLLDQSRIKVLNSSGGLNEKLFKRFNINYGHKEMPTIYQYRPRYTKVQKRLLWLVDETDRIVRIIFYGKRSVLGKKLGFGRG